MSAAKGKIGRLPFKLRQELNRRMRDGQPDAAILEWLNGLEEARAAIAGSGYGGPGKTRAVVTPQNLSEYRGGRYQDWVAEEERVAGIQTLAELSLRMAEAAGGNVSESAVRITAGKLMQVLESATADDAERMAKALTGLSMAETAAARARIDRDRLDVQRDSLALDERKFQRQTAELFLRWYADKRAADIAEGKGEKEVKMDRLVQLMFGDRPAAQEGA